MKIVPSNFIIYKTLNSLFLGLSLGSVFVIYSPLKPAVYSVGGMALAVGSFVVAFMYSKILNIKWFFRVSLFVETVLLVVIIIFLATPYSYILALFVYIGYQILFTFGNYLVRAETLFLNETSLLSKLDSFKQIGYIAGMGLSYIFYKLYDNKNNFEQVYALHFVLFFVQILILYSVFKSFKQMR